MAETDHRFTNRTTYRLAGLRIVSDLPLPGLSAGDDETLISDQISIRLSRLPESLVSATSEFPDGQCNENELLLNIPEVARYLIRAGNEILVDKAPDSNPHEVAAFLLGSAFGVLWHQRGIPPLHASVIDVADGCVAFVGELRMGKSTLAAVLAARGYVVIADDVCFLQDGDRGPLRAWPGINQLRLCKDAVKALGYDGPRIEQISHGPDKYLVPMRPPQNLGDLRLLRRVYQLASAPDANRASISRLRGARAVEVFMQNIYRSGFARHMGRKPAVFRICAAAARDIPVFQFSRPLDFGALPGAVDMLEDHLRESLQS